MTASFTESACITDAIPFPNLLHVKFLPAKITRVERVPTNTVFQRGVVRVPQCRLLVPTARGGPEYDAPHKPLTCLIRDLPWFYVH